MTPYEVSKLDILLVASGADTLGSLREALHGLGARGLRDAGTVEAAAARLREKAPDILIIDRSAGLDAAQVVQYVRHHPDSNNAFLGILVLQDDGRGGQVVGTQDAGMTEFLAKPISSKFLAERIGAMVEKKGMFVRVADYFGPDRRQRDTGYRGPDRRRS